MDKRRRTGLQVMVAYVIIITIGINQYNFDNLIYKDIETCRYHKEKIEQSILFYRRDSKVECKLK